MKPTDMNNPPEKAVESASNFYEELKLVDFKGMVPEMIIIRNMTNMVNSLMIANIQISEGLNIINNK